MSDNHTKQEELRKQLNDIFKSPHCDSCHEDWDYDYSYKTDSCCTRFMKDSLDRVIQWHEAEATRQKLELLDELLAPVGNVEPSEHTIVDRIYAKRQALTK